MTQPVSHSRSNPPSTLATSRLLLRRPRLEDADAIFTTFACDAEATRLLVWSPHRAVEETREFVQACLATWEDGSRFSWIVTHAADGSLLGMIQLRLCGHSANVDYVLGRATWGRGYGTEALQAVLNAALTMPDVHRVTACCHVQNRASARVMEKAGMVLEGVLARSMRFPNLGEEPQDVFSYVKEK